MIPNVQSMVQHHLSSSYRLRVGTGSLWHVELIPWDRVILDEMFSIFYASITFSQQPASGSCHNLDECEEASVNRSQIEYKAVMEVIGFLYVLLGSSAVQLHDSLGSRRSCACSEAGFSSQNDDRA
jgi:hypothetical protein